MLYREKVGILVVQVGSAVNTSCQVSYLPSFYNQHVIIVNSELCNNIKLESIFIGGKSDDETLPDSFLAFFLFQIVKISLGESVHWNDTIAL